MRGSTARRVVGCLTVAAAAVIATGMPAAARAVPGTVPQPDKAAHATTAVVHGAWAKGQLVPGVAALNTGGDAMVTAVACAAPGYCTAGGYYTVAKVPASSNARKAFVVSEVKGHWGTARQVPGTGAGGWAAITTIACTSPGNCVAGGYDGISRSDASTSFLHPSRGFVASQARGHWGTARHLSSGKPGAATTITSVSCSRAGECLAGGYTLYPKQVDNGRTYLFGYELVTGQRHGCWGALKALTPETLLYKTPASVSCASPGNCAAGVGASVIPFIAQERGYTWYGSTVPGFPAGSVSAAEGSTVVSCPKAGACTAGGTFADLKAGGSGVWVASESGYRWRNGTRLAGLRLGYVFETTVNAISCTAPGYCTLAGQAWSSTANSSTAHGFTATETAGHWSSARLVVSGARGNAPSVSCPATGYCVAAVTNLNYAPHVIEQAGGTWGKPRALPGLTHPGLINSVSCAKPGWCTAGGSYSLRGHTQAILANETVP